MKYIVFPKGSNIIHCISGFASTHSIYHIRRNMPETELMLMVEGELHIKHLEEYCLKAGDVFLLPQNVLHYGTQPSTFKIHWVHLILPSDFSIVEEEELANVNAKANIILPILFHVSNMEGLLSLAYQLEQYPLDNQTQVIRDALIKAILCDIAYRYGGVNITSFSHKRLNSIVNYINSNLEKPITVKDLTDLFGYNEKYIFNLFKRYLGISPLQYIIRQKMNRAQYLLLTTGDKIEAIAYNLGYDNPRYFVRLFKKTFNCTPTEFRKTYSHSLELFYSSEQQ